MSPFRFGALAVTPGPTRQSWLEGARRLEASGYSTLQVNDHFTRTPLSPLLALAAAAQVTSTIGLGTLVLDNDFRNPAILAKEAATLELLSDGRLELGIGAGWLDEDYTISGIAMERPGIRVRRLEETVQIVRRSFAGDESVSMIGDHYQIAEMKPVPGPVRSGGPPILLGGGGPRVLSLAAREADTVSINMLNAEGYTGPASGESLYADATEAKVRLVRDVAAAAGRNPELHLVCYWAAITEHPATALQQQIDERGIPVSVEQAARSPHCLVGPLGALQERIFELRERWGFSYFTMYASDAATLAPLVEAVSGR